MRHITGRAVRTAIGTAAAIATLALPLVLGTAHAAPSDGTSSVRIASDPVEPVEFDDPKPPKPAKPEKPVDPEKPIDTTGSWVWDDWE
ncbi:hypothetical protein [Streptomyces sp. 2A115]|uniref:hypothetical protein n=1 Tax=Streptomyces sp. 2A115 TaxID=3457439 RepID=UPI003FD21710